MASMQLDIYR